MFDSQKIDKYFTLNTSPVASKQPKKPLRERVIRLMKITLPAFAAFLAGLLIIIMQLKKNINDIKDDIITPRSGELEKFHMEKGIFYITDSKNILNNFNADTLDETAAGSKIIKMINPSGTLPTEDKNEVHIKSPLGFYNQESKLLHLQKGVDLDYTAGITAQTEEMFFDFNKSKAYSVKPTTTNSETADIKAQGFEYYKDKNILIYTGKSHVTIKNTNLKEAQ